MRSWTPVDQYVYGVSLAVASRYSRYKIRYKIRLKSVTKLKIFFACGGLKKMGFHFSHRNARLFGSTTPVECAGSLGFGVRKSRSREY